MGIISSIFGRGAAPQKSNGEAAYEEATGAKRTADIAYEKATGAKKYTEPKTPKTVTHAQRMTGLQNKIGELGVSAGNIGSRINSTPYDMGSGMGGMGMGNMGGDPFRAMDMGLGGPSKASKRSKPKKKLQPAFYDAKTGKTYVAKNGGKKKSSKKKNKGSNDMFGGFGDLI